MAVKFVNKVGGLDQRTAEDVVDPSNASVAQYLDPFRAEPGEMASAYGFKTDEPTIENPAAWAAYGEWDNIVSAFKLGPYEIIVTGRKLPDSNQYQAVFYWYINESNVLIFIDPWEGQGPRYYFHNHVQIIPSHVMIDPLTPVFNDSSQIYSDHIYYQAILYGHTVSEDENSFANKPVRMILDLKREYAPAGTQYTPVFSLLKTGFVDFLRHVGPEVVSFMPAYVEQDDEDSSFGENEYFYIMMYEDLWGNYITSSSISNSPSAFEVLWSSGNVDQRPHIKLVGNITRLGRRLCALGIFKTHIYRANITAIVNDYGWDEDFYDWEVIRDSARWKDTYINEAHGLPPFPMDGNVYWRDPDGSEAQSADLISPGTLERTLQMENINKANEAIGYHNKAFWIAKGNEVFFSQYHLDAPFGVRPLNFPTMHRWVFDNIGDIKNIVSVGEKLVVFGSSGISTLSGTYLDNFVEKRISSRETNSGRAKLGEYINSVTLIDDKIYFVSKDGKPSFTDGYDVAEIPGVLIPHKGSTFIVEGKENYYKYDPFDTTRFRRGWLISNGSTMFLYDPATNRWVEWPRAIKRFIIGHSPYYEKGTLSGTAATEYDYLRYIGSDGKLEVYATDGTWETAIWKTPKILFENDQKFDLLVLHWRYNDSLPYGEVDIDSTTRTTQVPTGTLSIFLDEKSAFVSKYNINLIQDSEGQYRFVKAIGHRGRKFAFQLEMANAKFWHFTGWELKHSDRGRKSYG